jgi:DNA transposition AAA+ family ATPase
MKNKEKKIYNHDYLIKKIDEYIKYYDITLKDFAIRIGMSEETLKRTLNNDRVFYVNEIQIISNELAFNTEEMKKAFLTESVKGGKDE